MNDKLENGTSLSQLIGKLLLKQLFSLKKSYPTLWQLDLCLRIMCHLNCRLNYIWIMEAETEGRSAPECLVNLCCPVFAHLCIPMPKASWDDKK